MNSLLFRLRQVTGRPRLAVYTAVFMLAAALAFACAIAAFAQESGGPTPEEIEAFERSFTPPVPEAGGPDESAIERPEFEEPGTIPEEVRKQVPESQLVAVYCAMTRWKSGAFFAAMDAVERLIVPAARGLSDVGVSVDVPDTAALKAEGENRVKAICAAATVDDADRLVREFAAWGKSAGEERFASMRADMRAKIQAIADAMRAEIKKELDPFIEERKAAITAEISAAAKALANQKSERFKSYTKPPTDAEINALKAEITRELQGTIDRKKAEVEAAVQAKVKEIVGTRQQKLEAAAGAFTGMEKKMNDAIREGSAKYDTYRDEAIALRKKMVLDILDASTETGLKELDARAADVDDARASDPSVPSVADVRSQIAQSRKDLEAKLDAALRSGDEAAFQAALADFRVKWETYRTEMERAVKQSAGKICTVATAQFSQARAKIGQELRKLSDLESKCTGSATEECLKVNEFAPRFGTIKSSLSDLVLEMAVVEKMCEKPEGVDGEKLKALLDKIKADADAVKVYGEALEAEKSKAIADSAAQVCAQVLPQVRAGTTEIGKYDLPALEAELKLASGGPLPAAFERLKSLVSDYHEASARIETMCQAPSEETFQELRDILNYIKGTGEKIRVDAAEMQYKYDTQRKLSKKQVCETASIWFNGPKQEMSRALAYANAYERDCLGKEEGRCAMVSRSADKIPVLREKIANMLSEFAKVEAECKTAGDEIDAAFIARLNALKADGEEIKKLEAEFVFGTDKTWPDHMRFHKVFKVVLDVAPSKFDDSKWTGDWRTDQMGTIRGGETYTLTYTANNDWQATGFNEGTGKKGTWSYRAGDPQQFQLNIWGRIYTYDDKGNVYDPDFGLVGHLVK